MQSAIRPERPDSSEDLDGTEELFAALVDESEPCPGGIDHQLNHWVSSLQIEESIADKRAAKQDRQRRTGGQGLGACRRAAVQAAQQRELASHSEFEKDEVPILPFASLSRGDAQHFTSSQPDTNPYDSGLWPKFVAKRFMRQSAVPGGAPTLVFGVTIGAECADDLLPALTPVGAANHYTIVEPFEPAQLPVVDAVFGSTGLRRLPRVPRGAKWCVRWSAKVAPIPEHGMARWSLYGQLGAGQYYNHFPGSHELGHKHRLHDNFEHRIACCGGDASSVAHFWPRCWELSSKAQRECAKIALTRAYSEWSQCACNEADAKAAADDQRPLEPLWIVKPINLSRGLGIRLVSQWEEISQDELSGSLIQRYIDRPLLIDGRKSDLRLYVIVTGVNPLRIYLHESGEILQYVVNRVFWHHVSFPDIAMELLNSSCRACLHPGLVRFAIERYTDGEELGQKEEVVEAKAEPQPTMSCGVLGHRLEATQRRGRRPEAHLTNSSLHADSVGYVHNGAVSADGVGSKWSLDAFWRYIQTCKGESGAQDGTVAMAALRRDIDELVVKTVLAAEPAMRHANEQLDMAVQAELAHALSPPTATAVENSLKIEEHCFEMFGFDVLVDEQLKPWLLEVNTSPSLACASPLDMDVKTRVMTDLLNIVGIPCCSQPSDKTTSLVANVLDKLEHSLEHFSEASQQPLTDVQRSIIRDFEAEAARASVAGCGARLLYPTKGCGRRCHGACVDRTTTVQNALLQRWVDSKYSTH